MGGRSKFRCRAGVSFHVPSTLVNGQEFHHVRSTRVGSHPFTLGIVGCSAAQPETNPSTGAGGQTDFLLYRICARDAPSEAARGRLPIDPMVLTGSGRIEVQGIDGYGEQDREALAAQGAASDFHVAKWKSGPTGTLVSFESGCDQPAGVWRCEWA
jgi:hypothetical protein